MTVEDFYKTCDVMCCYVDGAVEYRKDRKKTEKSLKDLGRG